MRITLRPLPAEAPWWVRVRILLKIAWRAFGLRNLGVEELEESPRSTDSDVQAE